MRDASRMSLTISDHYLSKISKIPERWPYRPEVLAKLDKAYIIGKL